MATSSVSFKTPSGSAGPAARDALPPENGWAPLACLPEPQAAHQLIYNFPYLNKYCKLPAGRGHGDGAGRLRQEWPDGGLRPETNRGNATMLSWLLTTVAGAIGGILTALGSLLSGVL
jgi:hypothetical protein